MNARPIDISKKSNIKCEYCANWRDPTAKDKLHRCVLTGEAKYYYNRCKSFKWREDREYISTCGGVICSVKPFESADSERGR